RLGAGCGHVLEDRGGAVAPKVEVPRGIGLFGGVRQLLGLVQVAALQGGAGGAEQDLGIGPRLVDVFEHLGGGVLAGVVNGLEVGRLEGQLLGGVEVPLGQHDLGLLHLGARQVRGVGLALGGGGAVARPPLAEKLGGLLLVGGGDVLVGDDLLEQRGGGAALAALEGLFGLGELGGAFLAGVEGGGVALDAAGEFLLFLRRQVGEAGGRFL